MTLALLLLLSCAGSTDPGGSGAGDGGGDGGGGDSGDGGSSCPDSLVWETAGLPLTRGKCGGCHSASLAEGERSGAPVGIDLDTLAGVRTHAERAVVRMQAGEMPPSGGVSEVELARFIAWLDCGAPGDEVDEPALTEPLPVVLEVSREETADDGAEPGVIAVSSRFVEAALPWQVERWLVDEAEAWLLSVERYDDAGALASTDSWEPPLPLVDGGEGVFSSTRTRQDASGSSSWDEVWTVDTQLQIPPPTLLRFDQLQFVHAVEDGGDELILWLAEGQGVVRRQLLLQDDDTVAPLVGLMRISDPATGPPGDQAIWAGASWDSETMLEALP